MMAGKAKPKVKVPKGLCRRAAGFYRAVVEGYELEPHHCELLEQAARCLDRIDAAGEAIRQDGLFALDRFGQRREHPAVAVEAVNKRLFRSLLRELGLDVAVPEEHSRPKYTTVGRPRGEGSQCRE